MKKITDSKGTWKLHNGVEMPYLGLGVWQSDNGEEVITAVEHALDAGYRHIDTAAAYKNEEGVGKGFRESGLPRKDVFITSKVWNSDQGYESTLKAFDTSMDKLGLETLDLYLIHWPVTGKYKDTWRILEKLYNDGRVRAIGVSNFLKHHLEDLIQDSEIVPMVNQMEFHPKLVQQELIDFCNNNKIQYEAWSPLMQGKAFGKPEFEDMAANYNKSVAQLLIRYDLQKGVVTIPKSTNKEHIKGNAAVFDFEISDGDMKKLDGMDEGHRTGPDPDNFDF